jgi:hypothetical protein
MLGPSAKGMVTGKGLTQRTAYIAALATYVPLVNGIMTYLKTGSGPKGMDYLAYRTGGTDATSGSRSAPCCRATRRTSMPSPTTSRTTSARRSTTS